MRNILCVIAIMALALTGARAGQTQPTVTTSCVGAGTGHKINGYKYLCMQDLGNQYELEDKFNSYFESKGFVILSEDEENELDEAEKNYVLYGSYVCVLPESGAANLSLSLRNKSGKMIFSCSKEGTCMFSPKCEFRKASNKIIKKLDKIIVCHKSPKMD